MAKPNELEIPLAGYKLNDLFAQETDKSTQARLFNLITLILPDPESPMHIVDSNFDISYSGITYSRFPVKFTPAEQNSDGSISRTSITIANVSREIMAYVEKYKGLRNCRVLVKAVYENVLDEIYTPNADGTVSSVPNDAVNDAAFIEDEFFIDTYTANEQVITFQLEPIINLEIRIPRRRYMVDSCYWTYGEVTTCKHLKNTNISVTVGTNGRFTVDYTQLGYKIPIAFSLGTIIGINSTSKFGTIIKAEPVYTNYILTSCTYELDFKPASNISGLLFTITCNKTLADCRARNNEINFGGFPGISGSRRLFI